MIGIFVSFYAGLYVGMLYMAFELRRYRSLG